MKKIKIIAATLLVIVIGVVLFISKKQNSPKYIFLFIGDGMSSAQAELTEIYQNSILGNKTDKQKKLTFTEFPTIGIRKNYSGTNYIPDSAASATALSSGILTYNGSINVDMNGNEVKSITYNLHEKGKKIGIITTMSLNHATPAAFYANAGSRLNYDKIAYDLVDSNFEYFAGGNIYGISSEEIQNYAMDNGYTIINDITSLNNISKENKNIVISPITNSEGFLPVAIDNKTDFNLTNYVTKGIEVLDNKNGFFMMIESGLIDIAGHNNDARSVISEVQELNSAVEVALNFAKEHPKETLIIVTGDHETGGLTLGTENNVHTLELQNLQSQKYSYEKLLEYSNQIINGDISYEEMLNYLKVNYGISNIDLKEVYNKTINGDTQTLKSTVLSIINENAGIHYSTTYHTGDRIPVYAYGIGSEYFSGIYDSAKFNQKLRDLTT